MERQRRRYIFIQMRLLSLFVFLVLAPGIRAQHPGVKYKQDDMTVFYHEISKYELENVDTLVDIGSGFGEHALLVFKFFPDKRYVLVDIDKRYRHALAANIHVNGKTRWFRNYREFHLGTDSTIPLPSSAFRRVLCRRTFHEFSKPTAMLSEMRRILSDDGLLIVEEAIPEFEGQSDPQCKSTYWKKEDLVEIFEANGFRLVSSDVTMYDVKKWKGNLNILKFRKA